MTTVAKDKLSPNLAVVKTSPSSTDLRQKIMSTISPDKTKGVGYAFQGYHYATAQVSYGSSALMSEICLDSGTSVTMGDRAYLQKHVPDLVITRMASPVPIRGVGKDEVRTDEVALVQVNLDGISKDGPATGVIIIEVHIVDDLKVNLLIGNDVMTPQGMTLDLGKQIMTIDSCKGIKIPINSRARVAPHIKRTIRSKNAFTVLPGTTMRVPVTFNGQLPDDRDFLFEPQLAASHDLGHEGGVFAHIVDTDLSWVNIHNATSTPVVLPKRARLGSVVEYTHHGCYMTLPAEAHLATSGWKTGRSIRSLITKGAALMATAYATSVSSSGTIGVDTTTSIKPTSVIAPDMEMKLFNGVTVYGHIGMNQPLSDLVTEYQDVFIDQGTTVDIPEEEWMPINLKSGVVPKPPAKVYPVGQRDKECIDTTFDKLQEQGKLKFTTQPTTFSYPCFVVWKDTPSGRKGRVVIDIRGLNDITEIDSYPLPLQSDIIAAVSGYPYISTVDAVGWFYQFSVQHKDRHKLTVVSHRGQEEFGVALMGYKGTPPYVQRQTDRLLRPYRKFARAFMDDIIIFSSTLKEHVAHLRQLFDTFRLKRVSLAPSKSFLGYPSVILLGQRVDSLGMSTSEEKIAAITSLLFPINLRDLEIFLGLTGWLRTSIPRYAQRANPLQERKTALTRTLPVSSKGPARKRHSIRVFFYDPTTEEVLAFKDLQDAFRSPRFLVHFSPKRRLYVDLDASKSWGFAAIIYHVKGDILIIPSAYPALADIEPIMFLSRCLNSAEKNYWPTELEIAGIVWVVRKIRHMIESTECPPTIIYTDHSAAIPISRQTSMTTSSTDKLNLRLVRASQYLSGFNLTLRHKSGKTNIVPDALSRLQADVSTAEKIGELEALYGCPVNLAQHELSSLLPDLAPVAYHVTLVEMADEFKNRLKKAYDDDEYWEKILNLIKPKESDLSSINEGEATELTNDNSIPPEGSRIGIRFRYRNGLLYYVSADDGRERLCIPASLEEEIFRQAHDRTSHGGFHRTYDRIVNSIYIRHLNKRLRTYIAHCPECQLNQTKRHAPYGELNPIVTPAMPFHTIAMDFIVALPGTPPDWYDSLLTITDKFSKKVLLLQGKTTYDAVQWANIVIVALLQHDWGIPRAIISDRDAKFMSSFWKTIFSKLKVAMLTSTAYHPQTDGQSERTNQTIEIALRYHLTTGETNDWVSILPFIQTSMNNAVNVSTGFAPNELLYGFKVNDSVSLLSDLPAEDFGRLRMIKREEADSAMAFASAMSKIRYDKSHKPIAIGDKAFLKLHHGYTIPGLSNRKLSYQRVGPFKVLEKVGNLAYRLELPPSMKIHPVISIAQLEPHTGPDPYGRLSNPEPPPVEEEGEVQDPAYEVEKLLNKRITRGKNQYLVKWKGYGHEHNGWYKLEDLKDCKELVDEYEAGLPREGNVRRGRGRQRGR